MEITKQVQVTQIVTKETEYNGKKVDKFLLKFNLEDGLHIGSTYSVQMKNKFEKAPQGEMKWDSDKDWVSEDGTIFHRLILPAEFQNRGGNFNQQLTEINIKLNAIMKALKISEPQQQTPPQPTQQPAPVPTVDITEQPFVKDENY